MIKLIYVIEIYEREAETTWLYEQKIYPTIVESYNWDKQRMLLKVGMIVSPDSALAVKLRHPLQFQSEYKQR